jgi:hypothetical protein
MRISVVLATSLVWIVPATGQTKVDLRSQSKNVDFSQAQSVRPFRMGTALPPTCTPGEMFFKSDAVPGANTFGCVAANIWAFQGELDPVTDFETELDGEANRLTVSCNRGNCNIQEGDEIAPFGGLTATFMPATGSYTAYVYLEGLTLRYGYAAGTMSMCSTSCVQGVTAFPSNAVPLFTATVINGAFQSGSLTDRRSRYRAPKRTVPGANIVISETADAVTWSSLPNTPLQNQPVGAQPACSSATRGTFWHVNGAAGVKDSVSVCAKDAANAYAWRTLY